MSEVRSRPHVQSISGTAVAGVAAAAAIGGLVLAAAVGVTVAGALGRALAHRRARQVRRPDHALPLSALRDEIRQHEADAAAVVARLELSALDALKAKTLFALDDVPALGTPADIGPSVARLLACSTMAETERAAAELRRTLESGHERLFVESLGEACRSAMTSLGFEASRLDARTGGATARVVGRDAAGRVLVSEIRADEQGEVSLEAEVVGLCDDSCRDLLDRFDRALEVQGVRAGAGRRRPTGGVPELEIAREFVRGLPRAAVPAPRSTPSVPAPSSDDDARRRQRLNAPGAARQGRMRG